MYVIMIEGRKEIHLFLVDRNKTKKWWWTYDLNYAMVFEKKDAALTQLQKLKHKSPCVIKLDAAKRIREVDEQIYNDKVSDSYMKGDYEHPFSSDALGQD